MQTAYKIVLRVGFFTLLVVMWAGSMLLANEPLHSKKTMPKKIIIANVVYANQLLNDFEAYDCRSNPQTLAIHKEVAGVVAKRFELQGFDVVNLAENTYSCSSLLPEDVDEMRSSLAKWSREVRIPSAEKISDDVGVFSIFIYADTYIDASDQGKSYTSANCPMMASALLEVQQPNKPRKAIWSRTSQLCSSKVFASKDILESVVRGDSKLRVKKADVQTARTTCLDKVLRDIVSKFPRYESPDNNK